jgi:hypothetical protein
MGSERSALPVAIPRPRGQSAWPRTPPLAHPWFGPDERALATVSPESLACALVATVPADDNTQEAQDMAGDTFKALVLEQGDEQVTSEIKDVPCEKLPEGDTLVRVAYSALNYKDGLALTGKNKVVRSYPMVPGIDFSGTVEETTSSDFASGDRVALTGWGVGERHWGGYAQLARVKSEWLVRLPENIDLKHAMGLGTAGVTAMLCILALEEHGLAPDKGDVLVTGAWGRRRMAWRCWPRSAITSPLDRSSRCT